VAAEAEETLVLAAAAVPEDYVGRIAILLLHQ
jgi:hypothetical protein